MTDKKFRSIAFIMFFAAFSFTSCKKGENDPAVSFKSRTARLRGDWVLGTKNVTVTTASTVGSVLTSITLNGDYNGTEENVVAVADSTVTVVRRYTFDIRFIENGSYLYTLNIFRPTGNQSAPFNNSIYTVTGSWSWLDQGANKMGLSLTDDFNPAIPDSLNPNTLLPFNVNGSYYIDRLASDELVLKREGQFTTSIDGTINTIAYTGIFKFKR